MFFPSTACLLQYKIGANNAWGFDLSAACSAFTYSLTTASQLVASGAHDHALAVGGDAGVDRVAAGGGGGDAAVLAVAGKQTNVGTGKELG